MPDYRFVCWFGGTWLAVRRRVGLREVWDGLPELCCRVARQEPLSARGLRMAEDFAFEMWWRSAMVVFITFFVIGLAANALLHGAALDAVDGLVLALVFCMAVACLQAVMAVVRAGATSAYLRRAGPDALELPLPAGALGVPRRWDFWAAVAAGCTMCAILSYAGLHAAPH